MSKFGKKEKSNFRQCPNCHYTYGYSQTFKNNYFRPLWKSWKCDNCGVQIRISPKSRLINVTLLGIIIIGLFQIRDFIENKYLYYSISIMTIMIFISILTLFEKFKLNKKAHNTGS